MEVIRYKIWRITNEDCMWISKFRYKQMILKLNSYSKFHLYSHFIFTTLYLTFREWKIDIDLSSFDGDPVLVPKSLFGVFPLVYIYYHTAHNKMKYNDSIIIVEIFLGLSETFVYKYMYPSLETCILNGNEISSIWKPEYICRSE